MQYAAADAVDRARRVALMIFDVDGVLTDGRLWYGPAGEALKAFDAFDGHGLKMLASTGVAIALLSGRNSPAVAARAAELGIEHVLQGIGDKLPAYQALLGRLGLPAERAGYMGDELVDLPVLLRCGFACVPREAPEDVRKRAHYVPSAAAGRGAAREACEFVMRSQKTLDGLLQGYLK
jgi:3-deoxy-D-manno-octulosonate 8-phosphate phosphatase (KDO 8-P phosphatase)